MLRALKTPIRKLVILSKNYTNGIITEPLIQKNISIQLKEDLKQSMKQKNALKSTVIKSILSDIQYIITNSKQKKEVNDELVYNTIFKGIETRQDSIQSFIQGEREDLIEKEKQEIEILKNYVPQIYSDEEIDIILRKRMEELGISKLKEINLLVTESGIHPSNSSSKRIFVIAKKLLN